MTTLTAPREVEVPAYLLDTLRDECFGFFTRPTKVARLPQADKQ